MEASTLSAAGAAVLFSVAEALAPAPDLSISDWVEQGEVILTARTNTSREGPVTLEGVEYIREPLDSMHPDDPCPRETVVGGAQTAKSLIGQLWVAWSIKNNPKSFAIGLPAEGEIPKYNDYKLQPIIEDSPTLASRVRPVSTKSDLGSSTRKKRLFNGASILVFNLGSPKELQMISTGNLILEEITNAPKDVGGRGSAVKQARERQAAYSVIGSKELMVSTPGIIGECEITKAYEAGDQRHYYGECPHCAGLFRLLPEQFKLPTGTWGAHFLCPGCGSPLFDADRAQWRQRGVWLPTFISVEPETNPAPGDFVLRDDVERYRNRDKEGRFRSRWIWQAMCGLISLDKIAESVASAKTPEDKKALEQQVYGRAFDAAIEALAWEELHRLREDYEHSIVPSGSGLVTGFCDVQGSYLQYEVYAWAPGAEWHVIDRGVIEGDTAAEGIKDKDGKDTVWLKLDEVVRRRYPHADGGDVAIEAFGVDTGFRTQRAYNFVAGRPNCYAMDGRPDWKTPIIGRPKPVKRIQNGRVVGRVRLFPTGTWELKSLLAWSLKLSIESGYGTRVQGRGHWSKAEDEAWAQQMTGEVLYEEKNAKTGQTDRWWKKVRANESLDCWVGARALAWMLGVGAPRRDGKAGDQTDWSARAAQRSSAAPDLFKTSAAPQGAAPEQPAPASERTWFRKKK